ncbi:glycoside hydrolase family 97 protein [Catenovulum sp. 2E275]|uniref:glycoside hydrolase family 97 protein n=1 Tax=Catenovulum sp. 2E275 TaxID=2980497 RepID=UPI0021CEE856|nr:glycoside hydrolase family 97 protein [Catenovulum sp. 2E275]MCU4677139.1 glycoside hydrolase family 97 protein [Catenovulum sp. 2E275]
MRYWPILLTCVSYQVFAADISVSSPDKNIKFTFTDQNNLAQYQVNYKDNPVISPSKLGFTFEQAKPMYRDFNVKEVNREQVNSNWEQPWGEQRIIDNNYNELTVKFTDINDKNNHFLVTARVFNDGIGFKYHVPSNKPRAITRELTEFTIIDSHKATAYWIPGQGYERYEYLYNETPLKEVSKANTPITVKLGSGVHLAIHEAALIDYASMSLNREKNGRLVADLSPRSDGVKVRKQDSFDTPWRTIQIGDRAVDLINSHLSLNLNEPNKLGDVSWIKPGKYVGIWWGMHIQKYTWGSGEKHGATTENTIKYMDFAAKHGFDGVLVEGWNTGWDGDWIANSELFSFTQSYPDFDIKKVSNYGKKIGVKLIGHHETSGGITNYESQMEEGFKLYQEMGVEQIKTGYVAHGQNLKRRDGNGIMRYEFTDSQDIVNHFIHNVTTAAKYKLSINTHESVKDTGLRRTYPNWISRESARGQEYSAGWSAPNPPSHIPYLVFTRMLSGPMDFTPGIFNLDYPPLKGGTEEDGLSDYMRPQTTIAKQLAEYVVIYSPIQMAADLPENYEAKPKPFQFIKDVPTDWEKSIALQGEVGDFIVIARKEKKHRQYTGKDWYLGAITNEKSRNIEVSLDFLDKGMKYEAQIYKDGKNADWRNNPYDIEIIKQVVTAQETLKIKLSEAGGAAIRFKAL